MLKASEYFGFDSTVYEYRIVHIFEYCWFTIRRHRCGALKTTVLRAVFTIFVLTFRLFGSSATQHVIIAVEGDTRYLAGKPSHH